MKTLLSYYSFEIRRAFRSFGRLILVTLLLAAICAGLATAALHDSRQEAPASRFHVAVAIPPNAGIHYGLALGVVTQMDSFQSMCTVSRVDSEEEAQAMLDAGTAQAAVIIPEGLIHGILHGTNIPARIIYPSDLSVESVLFRNMVDSLAHMLGTSQAGVYALYDIYAEHGADDDAQNAGNSALNSIYIDMVLDRSGIFTAQSLVFEQAAASWLPFVSGALTLLLLLTGICLCGYLAPKKTVVSQALSRVRVSSLIDCTASVIGAWCVQFCLFLIPAAAILLANPAAGLFPGMNGTLLLSLVVCVLFASSLQLFVCRVCKIREASIIVLFFLSLLLVFLGGGLLPMAFLPSFCRPLSRLNPASWMQSLLSAGLSGTVDTASMLLLFLWSLILTVLPGLTRQLCASGSRIQALQAWACEGLSAVLTRICSGILLLLKRLHTHLRSGMLHLWRLLPARFRPLTARASKGIQRNTDWHAAIPSAASHLFQTRQAGITGKEQPDPVLGRLRMWVVLLLKRTLRRPVYLALTGAVIAVGLASMTADSTSSIPVALWCEDPDSFTEEILGRLLTSSPDRLYRFYRTDSREELEEDILWGAAECGFVLPNELLPVLRKETEDPIKILTGSSTILDAMIREEVYASILDSYAPVVFTDYIGSAGHITVNEEVTNQALQYFDQWASSGSTFRVEYEDVPEGFYTNDAAFAVPLRGLSSLLLLTCVMAGMSQYRHDKKKQVLLIRHPWEGLYLPCIYSLLPAVLPAAAGLLCFYLNGIGRLIFLELAALAVYLLLLLLLVNLLNRLIKSTVIFDALIPILVVFCILYAPILTDLSAWLPGSDRISWLAPANWYLMFF